MSEDLSKVVHKIAQTLFKIADSTTSKKAKKPEVERGQFTFTDEQFPHTPKPREGVPKEQRDNWAAMAKLGKW